MFQWYVFYNFTISPTCESLKTYLLAISSHIKSKPDFWSLVLSPGTVPGPLWHPPDGPIRSSQPLKARLLEACQWDFEIDEKHEKHEKYEKYGNKSMFFFDPLLGGPWKRVWWASPSAIKSWVSSEIIGDLAATWRENMGEYELYSVHMWGRSSNPAT